MHELALADSIVRAVAAEVGDARVLRVRLSIGRLAAVVPDALRACFPLCARGTALEGAALEIRDIPARAVCRGCGAEEDLVDPAFARCRCGSEDLALTGGADLRIEEVEVT